MAGKNYFHLLHLHAEKEYKFKQSRSMGGITEERFPNMTDKLTQGVCLGLSAAWLSERLNHSHSILNRTLEGLNIRKKAEHPFKPGKREAQNIHERNTRIVESVGARNQQTYLLKSKSEMLDENGLYERMVDKRGHMVPTPDQSTHKPVVANYAAAISDACHVETLSPGTGALFSFTNYVNDQRVGKHTVAAYRSRGNTLYFFDSNCGAYKLFRSAEFFEAWKNAYKAAANKDLIFEVDGADPDEWLFVKKR
jgi:hypothetical protein